MAGLNLSNAISAAVSSATAGTVYLTHYWDCVSLLPHMTSGAGDGLLLIGPLLLTLLTLLTLSVGSASQAAGGTRVRASLGSQS